MWQATNDQLQGDFSQFPFWDEHGLDIKRYYNIVCLMYGSDPRAFWPLVSDSGMSVQRARRCEEEYEKKARAWDTLAEPHLVPEGEAPPPGNGQISILYRSAESEYGQYIEGVLREYRIWEQLADGLNQTLLLPNDITIVSGECGIANAFWNPQDRTVNICYEMMAMLTQMFSAAIQGDEQAAPDQPAPATGSEADALIGIWRADSADAQGGSVVTHLVFGADGKFAQITEWQGGAKFEMWGRYRLEGSQLVFGVQGWDPQERCVENRCTPIQLPQSHQQAIRFANADQLIVGSAAFKRQPR